MDITCSDNNGHYWTEHRIITIGLNAMGLTFIVDDQYENKIKDPLLNVATLDVVCNNTTNHIFLKANGITGTALNWKIQIKRINL
jgi:hypothetical protein